MATDGAHVAPRGEAHGGALARGSSEYGYQGAEGGFEDVGTARPAPGAPAPDAEPEINATAAAAKVKIDELWCNSALGDARHPEQKKLTQQLAELNAIVHAAEEGGGAP
jgi:hypothetical protein